MISCLKYFVEPFQYTFSEMSIPNFQVILSSSKITDIESYIEKFIELNHAFYSSEEADSFRVAKDKISLNCRKWILGNYIDSLDGIKLLNKYKISPICEFNISFYSMIDLFYDFSSLCLLSGEHLETINALLLNKKCKVCKERTKDPMNWLPCGCKMHFKCINGMTGKSNEKYVIDTSKKISQNICPGCDNPIRVILEKLWDEMIQIQIIDKEMIFKFLTC